MLKPKKCRKCFRDGPFKALAGPFSYVLENGRVDKIRVTREILAEIKFVTVGRSKTIFRVSDDGKLLPGEHVVRKLARKKLGHLARARVVDEIVAAVRDLSLTEPQTELQPAPKVQASAEEELPADPEVTKELGIEELAKVLELTIKRDDTNKVIQFLGMLLAYTKDSQINISNRGPSSSGKSYIPIELATLYFPPEDVLMVAYSSPTAFFHDQGEWDEKEKAIKINLERKILIFLDQPHDALLQRLRPLLSHDQKELLIKITDKREKRGMRTKNVKLIGFPSVLFCTGSFQRIDEQEQTRSIILSPETSIEKMRESIFLKALRKGNSIAYQQLICSNKERESLRKRVRLIRDAEIKHIIIKQPAEIAQKFIEKFPRLKPRHARDLERVISLAQAFALLNFWHRERDPEGNIYVSEKDVENAFKIYDQVAQCQELGIAPYLYQLYREVVEPIFEQRYSECEGGVNPIGITRQDIIKRHFEVYGRPLPDWLLRREILPALESAGLVFQELDPNNKRRKLVYPACTLQTSTDASKNTEKQEQNREHGGGGGVHGSTPQCSSLYCKFLAPTQGFVYQGKTYGPFEAGEVAELPAIVAENLRRRGFVEFVSKG